MTAGPRDPDELLHAAGIADDRGHRPHRPLRGDPLPDEPLTEMGYANRLIAEYGERIRYVAVWKRPWLVWDGKRWTRDATGQVSRWAKSIARGLTSAALAIESERERDTVMRYTRRGESASSIRGALQLASVDDRIAVSPEDLDRDPFLLNCPNGVLDLRTMQLRAHEPGLLLTKMTGAPYEPGADGPTFAKFLERVQPDPDMRAYLARLLGHALAGRVSEHVLPIFYGAGRNGKGTLIAAVLAALGDYADAADPQLLTARTNDAHPTSNADLFGLRLAVLHEGDAGRHLAEGTTKRLTGGDRVKARRMHEDFWSFEPSHTLVMLTNHKPIVSGTDEGIWSRLRLVPWDVVIPPEERDPQLGDRIVAELAAVLAWLADGWADYRRCGGLAEPEAVTAATSAYRAESDALGRFIEQQCIRNPGMTAWSSQLYEAWVSWCRAEGVEPGSQKAFSDSLHERGFDSHKSHGRMRWTGLGLAAEDTE
jgi:putative DNA primase/helicase